MSQSSAPVTKLETARKPRLPQNLLDERRQAAMDMVHAGNTNLEIENETQARFGTKIDGAAIAKLRKLHRRKTRKIDKATRPKQKAAHALPPGPLKLAAQYMRNAMQAEGLDVVTLNAKEGEISTMVKHEKTWSLDT